MTQVTEKDRLRNFGGSGHGPPVPAVSLMVSSPCAFSQQPPAPEVQGSAERGHSPSHCSVGRKEHSLLFQGSPLHAAQWLFLDLLGSFPAGEERQPVRWVFSAYCLQCFSNPAARLMTSDQQQAWCPGLRTDNELYL